MHTPKHNTKHTDSNFFKEVSCTYLVEILPIVPAAELCASLVDNSTTFGIPELATLHGNQRFSLVPG